MPTNKLEDVVALLGLVDMCADRKYGDLKDSLQWRSGTSFGESYDPITFFINCNDLFYWGCADSEEIEAEDIPDFDKCFEDVRVAAGINDPEKLKFPHGGTKEDVVAWNKYHDEWYGISAWAPTLWCCRKRKMRPQIPYYRIIPTELHELFNACGPVRTAEECG